MLSFTFGARIAGSSASLFDKVGLRSELAIFKQALQTRPAKLRE